ncbi:hypothetical protein MY11210_001926 [Beauveria gryllotalpidicola]
MCHGAHRATSSLTRHQCRPSLVINAIADLQLLYYPVTTAQLPLSAPPYIPRRCSATHHQLASATISSTARHHHKARVQLQPTHATPASQLLNCHWLFKAGPWWARRPPAAIGHRFHLLLVHGLAFL